MNKQCNAKGSKKTQQRSDCIESMDRDIDRIVVNLNLEEIIDNYITWNHLIVGKQISPLSFLKC